MEIDRYKGKFKKFKALYDIKKLKYYEPGQSIQYTTYKIMKVESLQKGEITSDSQH